jgi:hypothetical protein
MKTYNDSHHEAGDQGVGRRAGNLLKAAKKTGAPSSILTFLESYEEVGQTLALKKTNIATLFEMIQRINLSNAYWRLRSAVTYADPALMSWLEKQGVDIKDTGPEIDRQNILTRYLSASLDITPTIMSNTCQAAAGISHLARLFGPGILVLLPSTIMNL